MSSDFSPEQKRYLEGFVSGLQSMQAALDAGVAGQGATSSAPSGPDAIHPVSYTHLDVYKRQVRSHGQQG